MTQSYFQQVQCKLVKTSLRSYCTQTWLGLDDETLNTQTSGLSCSIKNATVCEMTIYWTTLAVLFFPRERDHGNQTACLGWWSSVSVLCMLTFRGSRGKHDHPEERWAATGLSSLRGLKGACSLGTVSSVSFGTLQGEQELCSAFPWPWVLQDSGHSPHLPISAAWLGTEDTVNTRWHSLAGLRDELVPPICIIVRY